MEKGPMDAQRAILLVLVPAIPPRYRQYSSSTSGTGRARPITSRDSYLWQPDEQVASGKEFDMDFYRSLSDAADRPSIATPSVIERNEHNLKAAPVTYVMYEQLEYLIGHSAGDCPPECMDCDRLQQVRNLLLQPFRSGS